MKLLKFLIILLAASVVSSGQPPDRFPPIMATPAYARNLMVVGGGVPVAAASLPSDVAGLLAWYEAESALCTGACSDQGHVSTWEDKSTNNNDLTPYAGNEIHYCTNQINGKAAIRFVGGAQHRFIFGSSIAFGTGKTIFVVMKKNSTDGKDAIVSSTSPGSLTYWANASKLQGADKGGSVELSTGTAAADENWHQMNMTYDGTTVAFRLARSTDGGASNSQTITQAQDTVGLDAYESYLDADVAALIIYSGVLSAGNITIVENYLNGLYGL
jgi:hypothetical protein